MQTQPHIFTYGKLSDLPYLVYLPDGYETSDDPYPLLLFLHGKGERGNNLELIKKEGLTAKLESGDNLPFIVIAPQCPLNTKWEYHLIGLYQLVRSCFDAYQVDVSRVYITGLSMGGAGTWSLITEYPNLFAAAIPICGRERNELDYPERLKKIIHLPLWHFHGSADTIVPLSSAEYLVSHLKEYGGNPKLTVYDDVGHDSWTQTYANPEIYDWLLSHRLDVEK